MTAKTVADRRTGEPLRLAFLLVPQFSMMAFSAALEPLRAANRLSGRSLFEWQLTSLDGDAVTASNGIPVAVHLALDRLDKVDMVIAVVGLEPLQFQRGHRIHHLLRRFACHGCRIGGVTAGAFLLADAGLLTGRYCTVHWEYAGLFRSRFPRLRLTDELFVVDGQVFTCSGGTAALDMMLHFVTEASDVSLARAVAEQFIHSHIRTPEGGQRMEIHARYGIESPKLIEIIRIMEAAVEEPVDVTSIAKRVAISTRQVERLFREYLNSTPRLFYMQLRVARAQALLRQTLNPIYEVAIECGFTSTSHFSNAYKRLFGVRPTQERRRALRQSSNRPARLAKALAGH